MIILKRKGCKERKESKSLSVLAHVLFDTWLMVFEHFKLAVCHLPHHCLNPPAALQGQRFFLTCLHELLGMFQQWLAGWEQASAEPKELPALGHAVPVNTEQTVLLQPRKILGLTTCWLQRREPHSHHGMLCHSAERCKAAEPSHRIWQPVSVHQPQPICKHRAKSWLMNVMAIANLMNKHKLQFKSSFGSSDPGSILLESHWQLAVQAPMSLRCALSAVCVPLPSVPGSFAQGTSTLPANWCPLAWKNEHVDGIV